MKELLAAVTVLAVSTVQAATIYVDAANCPGPGDGSVRDPYCSIQTAIDNVVDTDEIVVAPGTYFETINFLGKATTLQSSDGADVTTIDATGFLHVVQCVSGEGPDTVLDGFTITGGNANGVCCGHDSLGGGMYNLDSSPTVTNCTFSGNSANHFGGGMSNLIGSPTVTNCTFSGNTAGSGGGMSNVRGNPTVTKCTFSGNTAASASGAGGGMYNDYSSPTVTNCTFSENSADHFGGGMSNLVGSPTVTNCTFSGNTACSGGGIRSRLSGIPQLANCVLWGNMDATGSGPTAQIAADTAPIVLYSTVQGGWPGVGNIDADPLFVDPDNGDDRLSRGSPCIDAGDNTALPKGTTTDLDGNPRFVDDPDTRDCPQAPGTCGDPPIVDMGAYEFQGAPPCPWDCGGDNNSDVGITDFLALLAQWGGPGSCDFDGGGVGINDFLELLANWGPCP